MVVRRHECWLIRNATRRGSWRAGWLRGFGVASLGAGAGADPLERAARRAEATLWRSTGSALRRAGRRGMAALLADVQRRFEALNALGRKLRRRNDLRSVRVILGAMAWGYEASLTAAAVSCAPELAAATGLLLAGRSLPGFALSL